MTLRSLLAAAALLLPACAPLGSTRSTEPTDAAAHAGAAVPTIDPMSEHQAFPSLRGNADLASVDSIAMHMQKVLGDSAAAEIRVCVDPTGQIASVKLLKSSGMAAYDRSVLDDVAGWQFNAPAGKTACEDATIVYTLR